jgi:hypothetical protein
MQRCECGLWMALALGIVVLLSGCGGLEKGPAPNLPYTPEPPAPKPEKKADTSKGLGPSLPVPIKAEPLTTPPAGKKDGAAAPDAKKTEAPVPEAKKAETPAPDVKKTELPAPDTKKGDAPKAEEKK